MTAMAAGPPAPRSQPPLTVFIQHRALSHHLFFGEAAAGFISGELSDAAALRYQSSAKVKEAGEGRLCGERL